VPITAPYGRAHFINEPVDYEPPDTN
jgi:hypothetical protein